MKKNITQLWNKTVCAAFGHIVNPGDYTDRHGNHDSLTFCERCGEYDVAGRPAKKIALKTNDLNVPEE